MGLFSTIGGAISACVSVASKLVSTVAPAIASLAKPVLELSKIAVKVVVQAVVTLVSEVAKSLGIVDQDMEPEELGARAMQNKDIKPEDFNSKKEYIEALKNAEFDEEKFKEDMKSDSYKLACTAVGTGLEVQGIAENMAIGVPLDFFVTAAKGKMNATDTIGLLTSMKQNNITDAGIFTSYTQGELSSKAEEAIKPALANYESKGGKSVDAIQHDIDFKTLEKSEAVEG